MHSNPHIDIQRVQSFPLISTDFSSVLSNSIFSGVKQLLQNQRIVYCTVINMQQILVISDYTAIGMPITYPLISINIPLTSHEYSIISPIRMMWAKQCHKPSPKSQFLYIGGLETIPSHGWFMTWFYPH